METNLTINFIYKIKKKSAMIYWHQTPTPDGQCFSVGDTAKQLLSPKCKVAGAGCLKANKAPFL